MVSIEVIILLIIGIISLLCGLYLIISGIVYRYKDNRKGSIKKILVGIFLLFLLPVFGEISDHFQQRDYEAFVIGNYVVEGSDGIVLKLYKDNTFELDKGQKCLKHGNGKWFVWLDDEPGLTLNLNSDKLSYGISEINGNARLLPKMDNLDVLIKF